MAGPHLRTPLASPPDAERAAAHVLERCDELAAFSEEPDRLTRRFATRALWEAGEAVQQWMREAGMETWRDAIGNVVGRWEPSGGPLHGGAGSAPAPLQGAAGTDDASGIPRPTGTLLMGSHLDTVRNAGRYDGMLGVLVAVACVERLRASGRQLPFAVEIVGFADEEGVRFGTGYLGSGVFAGQFDHAWLERRDAEGVTLAEAISNWRAKPDAAATTRRDVDALAAARRDPSDLIGYCEVHIEQGPVLESAGLPVGVVSAIAGQTRARVSFEGTAGHAGTVPMALRRDALVGAAEWIVAVDRLARETESLVATVGQATVEPGAGNVIPDRVELSLDVRSGADEVRAAAVGRLHEHAREIAAARGLETRWETVQDTAAVACDARLADALAESVSAAGHPVERLASGAGHDAVMMSAVAPIAMVFVRCAGGISHNPAEAVTAADVAVAIDVTTRFIERLAASG